MSKSSCEHFLNRRDMPSPFGWRCTDSIRNCFDSKSTTAGLTGPETIGVSVQRPKGPHILGCRGLGEAKAETERVSRQIIRGRGNKTASTWRSVLYLFHHTDDLKFTMATSKDPARIKAIAAVQSIFDRYVHIE